MAITAHHRDRVNVVLSVVVPVHAVEGYLYQCLESIRAGLTADEAAAVEVIAVDDASPDGCGEMLESYAARHGDLRVVRLPHNVGLGPARNAGLAEARGAYVWFVDSDDWLPSGSVRAVLSQLRDERPDVLLIDHLRVHENGRFEVDASSHLLKGPNSALIGLQHTAWNRIVRRGFLLSHDLRFRPGWYEDVPFSHPVLIAAERVAVLDRVCYHYRVGRLGAITATRSDRHFEAFEQYERLHGWVLANAPDQAAVLFRLMIDHLLVVAGNDGRVPPHRRRAFFRRIVALYRRRRPHGYRPAGPRQRLVALGSYELYAGLRQAYRVTGRGRAVTAIPAIINADPTAPVTPKIPPKQATSVR